MKSTWSLRLEPEASVENQVSEYLTRVCTGPWPRGRCRKPGLLYLKGRISEQFHSALHSLGQAELGTISVL